MSLPELANLMEIIGGFAIIFGVVFGLMQLRQGRIQRRDLAFLECARTFEDQEFTEAYRLISELPPGLKGEELRALGPEYEAAVLRVGMKFETVALLVHKGVVPMDAIDRLVGNAAFTIWHVIEDWVDESRVRRSHPNALEWFQWLVERLKERQADSREPVFVTEANWKEPSI